MRALWLRALSIVVSLSVSNTLTLTSVLLVAACGDDGVEHPDAGGKGTVEYCGRADPDEQNCMACSSKPGCGFCAAVSGSAPVCQPGVPSDDQPGTCEDVLVISSADCPEPPPPVD